MTARATLLYDAGCGFCDGSVRWLAARDRAHVEDGSGMFRLVARASDEGEQLLRAAGVDPAQVDSVVLTRDGRAWVRSDAVLQALRLLGAPWSLAAVALVVPRGLRDSVYRQIARRRHAWSAHTRAGDACAPGTRRGQG